MMKLGKKVCVLGGAGFVGRAAISALTAAGYEVSVAVRRVERYRELALIPGVRLVSVEKQSVDALVSLFKGHDTVINLLADQSNRSETVEEADFVSVTQAIKKAAEQVGLARLIQLSQIGANATQAKSNWLRVLGEADSIIHNMAFSKTSILRAGLLIGEGDNTTRLYKAQLERSTFMMLPNAEKQVQPLWVKDFAQALVVAIKTPSCFNAKIELAGEERMTLMDLAEWVSGFMGLESAKLLPMCQANAKFMLWLGWLAPFKTVDAYQQKQLAVDLVSQQDFSRQFGFEPASIESILSSYIVPHKIRQRYEFFREHAGRNSSEFK
ncbi:MAG: NAD(P)H-binding protein [Thiomicrospira sp.]|uniref:NAD(P)H-binding protein n=1 Tax=Thiomicrospira sp. TaxID=935 RepID=UPI0019E95F9C|nr:NAD(P)H-binding protein [Thiomicrospira sp.]MBE0492843.1 NAD(P)H-binding protein [Thiomicrospira sp.]